MTAASFFAGVRTGSPALILLNTRTDRTIASTVEVAGNSETRRRGLLGRDSLDASTAIVIGPSSAIHTFFMRFAIDIIFIDRSGRVLRSPVR